MTEHDVKTEEYVDINHPLYEKRIVMTKVRDSEIIEFVKSSKRGIMKGYRAGNQQED